MAMCIINSSAENKNSLLKKNLIIREKYDIIIEEKLLL